MKKIFTPLIALLQTANLLAQTCNVLDQSFGVAGKQIGFTSNEGLGSGNIVVQPDNKIVQFGSIYRNGSHFTITRYNSDGSLDNSFGQSGRVISAISNNEYSGFGALQNDGKILVAGSIENSVFIVSRYNPDGTPDVTFGSAGTVIAESADQNTFARGLAVQSDGKIVVAGSTTRGDDCLAGTWWGQLCPNHFTVFRFQNNGSLDSSFGENGKVVTSVGPEHAGYASSVVLQPDDKIIVAGTYLYDLSYDDYYGSYFFAAWHFVMVRYNSNGTVDSSFGYNGIVADASGLLGTSAMSLQGDGKVLITGPASHPSQVERYNTDGSPDKNFGIDGKQFNDFDSWANSLLSLPNGKIIIAGGTHYNCLITRLNADGSFDTSFNGTGKLLMHLGPPGSYDNATAVALQGGHVIVGSSSSYYNGNYNNFAQLVLRLPDSIVGLPVSIIPRGTLTPCEGASTKLVVDKTGTIQWYKDGVPIAFATDTAYVANISGDYSVSVQNASGCGQSEPVRVTTNGLRITITPGGSLNICQGDSVTLTSSESGDVQWYKDGLPISGARDTVYTAKSSGGYFVSVHNAKGCGQSSWAYVNVNLAKPSITWDGTVLRTMSSSYYYQWYLNGDSIPGAHTFFFTPSQVGVYKVVIPDYKCYSTSDDFNLDCNLAGVQKPSIVWTGTMLATDGGYAHYQWYFNGDSIAGAQAATLTSNAMGSYKVTVTGNLNCQSTSDNFEVSCAVIGPTKPTNNWDGVQFFTTTGYAHYQWYQNDTAITGANGSSYTPGRTQFGDYKVVVTDNNNCSNTSIALPYTFTAVSNIVIGDARLRFYPNPTATVLNIDKSPGSNSKLQAELYDLNGKLLQKKLLNQANNQLSVDRLSAGLYQLIIYNGAQKVAVKIAVIK